MGQDLRAIIPHRLKPDRIFDLSRSLNSYNKRLLKLLPGAGLNVENFKKEDWSDDWDWFGERPDQVSDILDFWEKSEAVELAGPGSLFLSFGRQCVVIGSWIRWKAFLTDRKIFEGWRAIVKYFAGILRAHSAIYVPDSGPVKTAIAEDYALDGLSFETIKRFLLEHCGQPLMPIDTIKGLTENIYFYDDFGLKEYEEDVVLTRYILNHYREFITEWEHKVNRAINFNEKAEVYNNPVVEQKYVELLGEDFKNDINAQNEIKNPDAFRSKVRGRILNEHREEVFINRCMRCNKIVRTPKAKQCFWCGYDWH